MGRHAIKRALAPFINWLYDSLVFPCVESIFPIVFRERESVPTHTPRIVVVGNRTFCAVAMSFLKMWKCYWSSTFTGRRLECFAFNLFVRWTRFIAFLSFGKFLIDLSSVLPTISYENDKSMRYEILQIFSEH